MPFPDGGSAMLSARPAAVARELITWFGRASLSALLATVVARSAGIGFIPGMGEPNDFAKPAFWDTRYAQGEAEWSRQKIPASLNTFLGSAKPGDVLIPGCGSGHAVRAFAQAGWKVIAIDFSPVAVQQARSKLGELGERVLLGDFFQHDFGSQRFDLCYEQAFLCALSPQLWPNYASRVAQLLRPEGLLAGVFFWGHEPEPPPYPLDEAKAQELFTPRFVLQRSSVIPDPLPFYPGGERWMEWALKARLEPGRSCRATGGAQGSNN
jgi:SAM-dependent methyltransferase